MKTVEFFNLRERDHLEELGVDGSITSSGSGMGRHGLD
jgi:hypothetical protein